MLGLLKEQPRPFYMIFLLELWERFGFYTVQGILILYFIRFLGYNDVQAYYTFGAYTALLFGLVILGGYLGDQVLGTKRTILLGLIVLAAGYFALAISTQEYVFYALGLIAVGNGLFKANPSHLLSKCYDENDPRLHGGFTLYYMAINIGSSVALIVGPAVASKYGYFWAYLISSIGLLLGLLNYLLQKKVVAHINSPADLRTITVIHWLGLVAMIVVLTVICAQLLEHLTLTKWILFIVTALVIIRYAIYMRSEDKGTQKKMFVAFILMVQAVIFFTLYQQMPSSLNLFAVNNITPQLLGVTFDPQSFQALNPFWIITLSPLLALLYRKLEEDKVNFSVAHKFAAGMTVCAFSFLILYFARFFYEGNGLVSGWWLVASYFFQSLGELLVSALGLAMIAELVPASITGFVMGAWFLTAALAGYTGGFVATYTAIPENIPVGVESLNIYTQVFGIIGLVVLGISLIMWFFAPKLSRIIQNSDKDI